MRKLSICGAIRSVLVSIIIVLTLLTVYNCIDYYKTTIQRLNNNHEPSFVNSGGCYSEDDYLLDEFSGDALLYTLISNKEIIIPTDSFFHEYLPTVFSRVVFDNSLPAVISYDELPDKQNYIELGISLSRQYRTCFMDAEANTRYNYDPYIFVNTNNLAKCERVVLLHDDEIKMYVCDADLWYENKISSTVKSLADVVRSITNGYRIKEIIAATILLLIGYIVVFFIIPDYPGLLRSCLAFPAVVSIWCFICIFFLVAGIKITLFSCVGAAAVIFAILIVKYKDNLMKLNSNEACFFTIAALVVSIISSSAVVPILNTFDSYVFIYQYGNVLYNIGYLDFDSVGAMAGVTSIIPALMVILCRFIGFESIQVFHWILLTSMMGLILYSLHDILGESIKGRKSWGNATVMVVGCIITPSALRLLLTVNSLSYLMMTMTLLFLFLLEYNKHEKHEVSEVVLISMLLFVVSFLRIEGAIFGSFCIYSISCILNHKRELVMAIIPMVSLQMIYLVKIISDEGYHTLHSDYFFLSFMPSLLILACIIATVIYVAFFDTKLMRFIRGQHRAVCCSGLPLLCIVAGLIYKEKFITDINMIYTNLTNEIWNFFPVIVLIVAIMALFMKHRIDWLEATVIGYLFLNFGLCLGRESPLREGWGDSFNRMLSAIVPLLSYVVIREILYIAVKVDKKIVMKEIDKI